MSTPYDNGDSFPLPDLLPEQTADDTDLAWGDHRGDGDSEDLERFLRERPPHHGD